MEKTIYEILINNNKTHNRKTVKYAIKMMPNLKKLTSKTRDIIFKSKSVH